MYELENEKIKLCQQIGNFFGRYFEENGQLCIDNEEKVFTYNSADELLIDWVDTLVENHRDTFAYGSPNDSWEKEIVFIFNFCIGKHPVGVRRIENKKGTTWSASVDVSNPNHPHGKNVCLGTYGSVVDAIMARRLYLEEDIAGVDTNTEEGLNIALEKAKARRLQAKESLRVSQSLPQFAVVCTYPSNNDTAVYLFGEVGAAKAFLKDNYEETVKTYKESGSDISEFINGDGTYARIVFYPDDLDSDNETTEFRIGKIFN